MEKRSKNLIADFYNGFAIDWFMAVKECFRSELDIKFTPIVRNKATNYEWTQGIHYCFSTGQIIYDNKLAYSCWDNGIETIKYACQIIQDKPDQPMSKKKDTSVDKESKINGYVKFILYKINNNKTKIDAIACYAVSQEEFVYFLKHGVIGNEDYKIYDRIGQR